MINSIPHHAAATQTQIANAAAGMNKLFLSEMLKIMGPVASTGSFSGGNGEAQFSSFLIDAYADVASKKIDLGIF